MEPITSFEGLLERFSHLSRRPRVAVACPADDHTIYVIERCLRDGLADFELVCDGHGDDVADGIAASHAGRAAVHHTPDKDAAARAAVALVRRGEADVLMKGNINTDNLLRAVLDKECGLLPKGRVMSHITAVECPAYHKLLLFSDAAVIPRPNLDQLDAMVQYNVSLAHRMGIAAPKVALIHFTEKTNPKFQHTLDYTVIKERAAAGQYGDTIIGGPMDVKTACDAHSGQMKGIDSPVVGDADILVFPILEASNTFYKTVSLFGKSRMAGIITGTDAPVVVPSRADSAESKFFSLALACVASGS